MEQPPIDEPRHNKARERQRRRRERQQAAQLHTPRRRTRASQLSPADRYKLPQVDWRYLRPIALAGGAAIFMLAVIIAVGMFKNEPVETPSNAIWVGIEWTYANRSDSDVRDLVRRLRDHQIGTVYAHVSELNLDDTWTGRANRQNRFSEVEQDVTRFVAQFKRYYPESQLFGVLGVRADLGEDGYRLDDENVVRTVADFSSQVISRLGFDGIMLNIEPIWDGDDFYLALVRQVRQTVGDSALLALAVPPDWTPIDADIPTPSIIAPGTVWNNRYKQRVALLQVDQIVVRSYNSYLTRSDEYADWMAYQVQAFAGAVAALETDVQLLFGIPTYVDALPAHDTRVENVQSAVVGIQRGLTQAGTAAAAVRGVAIYAEWDTDESEWDLFASAWLAE